MPHAPQKSSFFLGPGRPPRIFPIDRGVARKGTSPSCLAQVHLCVHVAHPLSGFFCGELEQGSAVGPSVPKRIKVQAEDGAIEQLGGVVLRAFENLSNSYLFYHADKSLFIVGVKLQRILHLAVSLHPKVNVKNPGESFGGRVYRVNLVRQPKDRGRGDLFARNVALPWTFSNQAWEIPFIQSVEPESVS